MKINPGWTKTNNKWHHYIVIKNDNNESHYLDGRIIAQYYNRELTQKEIKELYNNTCR